MRVHLPLSVKIAAPPLLHQYVRFACLLATACVVQHAVLKLLYKGDLSIELPSLWDTCIPLTLTGVPAYR